VDPCRQESGNVQLYLPVEHSTATARALDGLFKPFDNIFFADLGTSAWRDLMAASPCSINGPLNYRNIANSFQIC
jgi:hypothetical protein